MKKLKIVKLDPLVSIPKRCSNKAAGWDIYSNETIKIGPGVTRHLKTGFRLGIPENHYVAIVPRSSLGKRGIVIPNTPATIDEDYTGEIGILLKNTTPDTITITYGERVAQMILHKYEEFEFEEVWSLEQTSRGDGGFGSTGV